MKHTNIFLFCAYSFILLVLIIETPNKIASIWDYSFIFAPIAVVGTYRYGLWIAHLVRASLYKKKFLKIRKKADSVPEDQWKPKRLYFMLVSYNEKKEILSNSVKSIVHEAKNLNLPVTICMGTASFHDEKIVSDTIKSLPYSEKIQVIFARREAPDKRLQIGSALRALVRNGVQDNDPIIFMDGDSIIYPGCLKKCLPIFYSEADIDALTTNEKAFVINSNFLAHIFNLRFAIRNFHMHSLSLSRKVLCLTGRFSIFRGGNITTESFISRIEDDHISDWYWEKVQFFSGDDKSTWYSLLKNGLNMLYVPDAYIYSVEKVENSSSFSKYVKSLKRWSGNMLRHNRRARKLGPSTTGFFLWLILLDQRISMWTALLSPLLIILMSFRDLKLTYMLIIWVLFIRYLQSILLFWHSRAINWSFPLLLYFNQILNAMVKVYMLFHLNEQQWSNQNIKQKTFSVNKRLETFQTAFANYIMIFYIVLFVLAVNAIAF